MVRIPVRCPYCPMDHVIKGGKTRTEKQRYRCQNADCSHASFVLNPAYQGLNAYGFIGLGWLLGVPVAGVQKTTIRTFMVEGEEKNEGLYPHIRWTKTSDFVRVYRGILPMNRVFFLTSALCLVRHTQARRVFQRRQ